MSIPWSEWKITRDHCFLSNNVRESGTSSRPREIVTPIIFFVVAGRRRINKPVRKFAILLAASFALVSCRPKPDILVSSQQHELVGFNRRTYLRTFFSLSKGRTLPFERGFTRGFRRFDSISDKTRASAGEKKQRQSRSWVSVPQTLNFSHRSPRCLTAKIPSDYFGRNYSYRIDRRRWDIA